MGHLELSIGGMQRFRREETARCPKQVTLPDFGSTVELPMGEVVPTGFLLEEPGEFEFSCRMGMYPGKVVVE